MSTITQYKNNTQTIEVTISLSGSLLDTENRILDACNDVGCPAPGEALKKFDTDGSPITMGNIKWTVWATDSKNNPLRGCLITAHSGRKLLDF